MRRSATRITSHTLRLFDIPAVGLNNAYASHLRLAIECAPKKGGSMTRVDEIAPDIFRISTYVAAYNLQFNQFVVRDDEPLLFETGMKQIFPAVREAVSRIMDPASFRYISFSHCEPDECGSLNEWLTSAPRAEAICSMVGSVVFVNDAAVRPARGLNHDETIQTGKYTFRFKSTPHLPHGWDAGMLFEETTQTLFCSDLLGHAGDVPPTTDSDVVGPFRETTNVFQGGPLANYMPYTRHTKAQIKELASLKPRMCATMHGSTFVGNGEKALLDMGLVMEELFG
jgi:flavorubredoxin